MYHYSNGVCYQVRSMLKINETSSFKIQWLEADAWNHTKLSTMRMLYIESMCLLWLYFSISPHTISCDKHILRWTYPSLWLFVNRLPLRQQRTAVLSFLKGNNRNLTLSLKCFRVKSWLICVLAFLFKRLDCYAKCRIPSPLNALHCVEYTSVSFVYNIFSKTHEEAGWHFKTHLNQIHTTHTFQLIIRFVSTFSTKYDLSEIVTDFFSENFH